MKDRILAAVVVGLAATLGMTTAAGILMLVGIVVVLPRMILGDLRRRKRA